MDPAGTSGDRQREGASINQSLSALSRVVCKLAELSEQPSERSLKRSANSASFVPYRESKLTWLLKESIGGNSKTTLIATISPADGSYENTLSTLYFAERAKKIKNNVLKQEEPISKTISDLKDEVERLKLALQAAGGSSQSLPPASEDSDYMVEISAKSSAPDAATMKRLQRKLKLEQALLKELTMSFTEKIKRTEDLTRQREETLSGMGLSISDLKSASALPDEDPFIQNISQDPLMSGVLVYPIKQESSLKVGRSEVVPCEIKLIGLNVEDHHCTISSKNGKTTITPGPALPLLTVNGQLLKAESDLNDVRIQREIQERERDSRERDSRERDSREREIRERDSRER